MGVVEMPETLQAPRPSKHRTKPYYIKLEYRVEAPSAEQAVDALVGAIRHCSTRDVWITRTADLQRTDVRQPGEGGDW